MLRELNIHNYAFLPELVIRFQKRLNIITGHTGSGKSVIVSAIEALFGSRRVLPPSDPERKRIIECEFDPGKLRSFLREQELEDGDRLIIRREIRPDGTSRFFINDSPVKMKLVRQIKPFLVDFHAQNELSQLYQSDFHSRFLDTFPGVAPVCKQWSDAYQNWVDLQEQIRDIRRRIEQATSEEELRRFQLDEIRRAAPEADEDSHLQRRERLLANAEEIMADLQELRQTLYQNDGAALTLLKQGLQKAHRVQELSGYTLHSLEQLEQAVYQVEELLQELEQLEQKVEFNPERLEEIRDRLGELSHLKRKYGPTLHDVIDRQQQLEQESDRLSELENLLQKLHQREEIMRPELEQIAEQLSRARQKTARDVEMETNPVLRELGIQGPGLSIRFEPVNTFPGEQGRERAHFLIATNPDSSFTPLEETASGGELSRVMLAMKSIASRLAENSSLVFDEIDSGISGQAAAAVGKRLRLLSDSRQVICITHLPQIAGVADQHFSVRKSSRQDGTRIDIRLLTPEERVQEIASLVGREPLTDSDLNFARDLIRASGRE